LQNIRFVYGRDSNTRAIQTGRQTPQNTSFKRTYASKSVEGIYVFEYHEEKKRRTTSNLNTFPG